MKAWWLKAYLFSREAGLTGPVLYLDLDTVVCGDLENLAALARDALRDARDGGHEERE